MKILNVKGSEQEDEEMLVLQMNLLVMGSDELSGIFSVSCRTFWMRSSLGNELIPSVSTQEKKKGYMCATIKNSIKATDQLIKSRMDI